MKTSIAAHGGDPNFTGCLQTELQRLVRLHTGRLSPLAAPLPQVAQPQQRALRSSVRIQAAAVANIVGFVFTPVADGPTVTGQVPSPTATGPILSQRRQWRLPPPGPPLLQVLLLPRQQALVLLQLWQILLWLLLPQLEPLLSSRLLNLGRLLQRLAFQCSVLHSSVDLITAVPR
jgi:hypothetical protein